MPVKKKPAARKKTAAKKKTTVKKKAAPKKKAAAKKKTTVRKKAAPKRKTAAKKKAAPKRKTAAKKKAPARKAAPKRKPAKAKKAKTKRKPNAAFMKPMQPSNALSAVVGGKAMPRTEVTKKLWAYIKKNGLQDAKKRTMINADANLKVIFGGKKQVSMFEMTKYVSKHLKNA